MNHYIQFDLNFYDKKCVSSGYLWVMKYQVFLFTLIFQNFMNFI